MMPKTCTYDAICAIVKGRDIPYRFVTQDAKRDLVDVSFEILNMQDQRHDGYLLLQTDQIEHSEVWRIWWVDGYPRWERIL